MSSVFYYTRIVIFFSTYDLLGKFIFVFGNVEEKLRTIESCSASFNFSSGSSLYNDNLSTPSDIV